MKCSKCGFENPENANYCLNCGSRMDGKIFCPKCGTAFPPDADECPNCKMKIPHNNQNENQKHIINSPKFTDTFRFVICIISIVIFALMSLACLGDYIVVAGTKLNAVYFLFHSWAEMSDSLATTSVSLERVLIIVTQSIRFALVLINILFTIGISIWGIIFTSKSLVNKSHKVPYLNLVLSIVVDVVCTSLLLSTYQNDTYGYPYLSDSQIGIYVFMFVFIAALTIVHILTTSDRGKKAILLEKLFLSISFFIGFIIICNLVEPLTIIDGENTSQLSSYSFFIELLANASKNMSDSVYVTALFLSGGYLIFNLLEIFLVVSFIIYFTVGFFSDSETRLSFRIPCFALGFVILLLGVIDAVLMLVATQLLKSYGYSIDISLMFNFVPTLLFFGGTMTSFQINRHIRQNEKLASQTTLK